MGMLIARLLCAAAATLAKVGYVGSAKLLTYKVVFGSGKVVWVTVKVIGGVIAGMTISEILSGG